MDRWADFDAVTRDALGATLAELGIEADDTAIEQAAAAFADLPLRDGAGEAVGSLHDSGLLTGVLSNASATTLEAAIGRIGLPLDHVLSVDAARRFKPHTSVYGLATTVTGLLPEQIGFVTANGWDAAGAGAFGFRVVWLKPDPMAVMPPVGAPEPIVASWPDVPGAFSAVIAVSGPWCTRRSNGPTILSSYPSIGAGSGPERPFRAVTRSFGSRPRTTSASHGHRSSRRRSFGTPRVPRREGP